MYVWDKVTLLVILSLFIDLKCLTIMIIKFVGYFSLWVIEICNVIIVCV